MTAQGDNDFADRRDGDAADKAGRGTTLLKALSNTGIAVVNFDLSLHVLWSENVPPLWSRKPIDGLQVHQFLPEDAALEMHRAQQQILSGGHATRIEIRVPSQDGACWFAVWVDPDRSSAGELVGVTTTAVDITDQKQREQTLRTLLREVAHRSKNLLAIIQSIATQTGRHAASVDSFMSRFRGRLQSLASTQDLVTSSNWRGAALHDLLRGQVSRYTADPASSIRLVGEKPYLNPNAALHVGLAFHELAVNSVSYGALARPDGFVSVSTSVVLPPEPPALKLVWSEAINIADQQIGQKRFGSVALERVVPASVGGSAVLDLTSDRLTYTLLIPQGNLEMEV